MAQLEINILFGIVCNWIFISDIGMMHIKLNPRMHKYVSFRAANNEHYMARQFMIIYYQSGRKSLTTM